MATNSPTASPRYNWAPDDPALAPAGQAHGEPVGKAEDFLPALRGGVAAVDAGRAAVVECVIDRTSPRSASLPLQRFHDALRLAPAPQTRACGAAG